MELLLSNIPPLKTKSDTFHDKFYELLVSSQQIKVCTGFVTQDAILELLQIVRINGKPKIQLIIGMHKYTGFEKAQYFATLKLNDHLKKTGMGDVSISTQFPYHGKAYIFLDGTPSPFAAIVGSSNVGCIVQNTNRTYDTDLFFKEKDLVLNTNSFFDDFHHICSPFDGFMPNLIENPAPLKDFEDVIETEPNVYEKLRNTATGPSFEIPLKADPLKQGKSNLNVYFGKGRLNTHTGIEIPRPWYEVELIVPKEVTSQKGYPSQAVNNGIITVITDDGWKFHCKVSGDYSKNFRSEGDLTILGRWIKGRLENSGIINPGDVIIDEALLDYGKSFLKLTYSGKDDVWLIDFKGK